MREILKRYLINIYPVGTHEININKYFRVISPVGTHNGNIKKLNYKY